MTAMATPRERTEEIERQTLAPRATLADGSKGRERDEPQDPVRTVFQRDRDRISHSKAFRRLKHKTQVFLAPEGDHYRVRLTHTLDVSHIARTVTRALRLNEDLAEAIALGHDLGHTPFGHLGEQALSPFLGRPFRHSEQSLRVVDYLEDDGKGLNLTWEVRDGIVNHPWSMPPPATLEAQVVRFADRIAYINHDLDDAVRAGVLDPGELPRQPLDVLGHTHGARINTLVIDLIDQSDDAAGGSLVACGLLRARRAPRLPVRAGLHARGGPDRAREGGPAHPGSVLAFPRASRGDAARVPSGSGGPADPRGRLHRRHDGPVRPADVRAALPSPGLAHLEPGAPVAGRIKQEDIEAVRERTDIVKLVSQYLTLKKAGGDNMTGLCPFHQEKTPSFSVSPGKQVFFCHGCGKGGDAIGFLRELEHLGFAEAVERLAQQAGVTLRYEGDSPAERRAAARRIALIKANEEAARAVHRDAGRWA